MSGLGKAACVILRLVVLFNRYVFVATVRSPILPDWNAASSPQELAALFHRWLPLQARHRIASAQRRRCQRASQTRLPIMVSCRHRHGPRNLVICTSRRNLLDAKSRQAGEITDDC
jgi:hypothetical protein